MPNSQSQIENGAAFVRAGVIVRTGVAVEVGTHSVGVGVQVAVPALLGKPPPTGTQVGVGDRVAVHSGVPKMAVARLEISGSWVANAGKAVFGTLSRVETAAGSRVGTAALAFENRSFKNCGS